MLIFFAPNFAHACSIFFVQVILIKKTKFYHVLDLVDKIVLFGGKVSYIWRKDNNYLVVKLDLFGENHQ